MEYPHRPSVPCAFPQGGNSLQYGWHSTFFSQGIWNCNIVSRGEGLVGDGRVYRASIESIVVSHPSAEHFSFHIQIEGQHRRFKTKLKAQEGGIRHGLSVSHDVIEWQPPLLDADQRQKWSHMGNRSGSLLEFFH
jgi:hypothetical protein